MMHLVSGKIGRQAYETGDWTKGLLSAGHALAFADRIEPMSAIVQRIADEAEAALKRLNSVTVK
jgi:nitronate monooxygenase